MKPNVVMLILVAVLVAVTVSAAKAQIDPSIVVKDLSNNVLNGQTVNLNTIVVIYCDYVDPAYPSTTGYIDVFLDQGSGFNYIGNIWTGPVNSGQIIQSPQYTLSQMGTYKFTWSIQAHQTEGGPCPETAQVGTTVRLVVPEPATVAGLAMGLSAFGLLAIKKKLSK